MRTVGSGNHKEGLPVEQTTFEEGVRTYYEAVEADGMTDATDRWEAVEAAYWRAYRQLMDSDDPDHQEICATILERISIQLEGEGRGEDADELRTQADVFRRNG
jgi:hypothetical protein